MLKQRKETPKSSDLPIYLFKQGNNQEAYRYFGAHLCEQNGEAGVVFRVWAPHAKAFPLWAIQQLDARRASDGDGNGRHLGALCTRHQAV